MAISSRGRAEVVKRWREREASPERTRVWTEPKPRSERKFPVVYYLCRKGHLEHPHFMEVALSSNEGLYLRDFINRLNALRGKGLASMYSWSSKRSYKNGFVWHDLSENDFIYPVHGQEYVLKGSELLDSSLCSGSREWQSLSSGRSLDPPKTTGDGSEFPAARGRNLSWSALDINEYKVYKEEPAVVAGKAANASTQTDEARRRRRGAILEEEEDEQRRESLENPSTELSREEISPPESLSPSPETLESLMKAEGGRVMVGAAHGEMAEVGDRAGQQGGGKSKASTVLMQLISCGSISVREHGMSLISQYKGRLPRGPHNQEGAKDVVEEGLMEEGPPLLGLRLEDKEYFSGSLIETNKTNHGVAQFQGLKRSSSYNADRSSKSDLMAKEADDGPRAKCIPRKPKAPVKREGSNISRSAHSSKRFDDTKS